MSENKTPAPESHKLALGDMPSYGNCSANDMLAAVADAIFGDRDISLLRQIDNDRPVGHQMVPTINFNSLNRIISAFHNPPPQTNMHAATVDRINQLEAELAEAVRWRDIYLRERNEERATFVRRAGELWQPLYDRAIAEREAPPETREMGE